MNETKLINDYKKKNNLSNTENFLSKKEINRIEKIKLNKLVNNIDYSTLIENKENINNNINIIAETDTKKNKGKILFRINTNKKKINEKKAKSFNQKIVDNSINEDKKQKKNPALKDIIEKLKTKKIVKEELIKEKKEEKIKENIPKGENNYNKKNKTNKDIKNKFINIPKKIKRKVIKKLITKKILQKMKVFYYHIKNIEMKMMKIHLRN